MVYIISFHQIHLLTSKIVGTALYFAFLCYSLGIGDLLTRVATKAPVRATMEASLKIVGVSKNRVSIPAVNAPNAELMSNIVDRYAVAVLTISDGTRSPTAVQAVTIRMPWDRPWRTMARIRSEIFAVSETMKYAVVNMMKARTSGPL